MAFLELPTELNIYYTKTVSASFVPSPVLNITHINRAHMGIYVCEAFNGVPPNDTQEFNVHVYCEFNIERKQTESFSYEIFAVSPTILVAETVVGGYKVKKAK